MALLGDRIDGHIKMVTALRTAVRSSMQAGIFPNVILSQDEYWDSVNFLAEIRVKEAIV
jgi:hypothetical protein